MRWYCWTTREELGQGGGAGRKQNLDRKGEFWKMRDKHPQIKLENYVSYMT